MAEDVITPAATAIVKKKIPGNSYFLFIDPAGGTAYSDVLCLVNFSFAGTTASNDASSMCGPDVSPGDVTSTVTFTGQTILDPGTGEISGAEIFTLWQDKENFGWKIGPATAASGDIVKTGTGFLSAYGENYDMGQVGVFNGTIAVTGLVGQTITP
jgi:hypothetical protein